MGGPTQSRRRRAGARGGGRGQAGPGGGSALLVRSSLRKSRAGHEPGGACARGHRNASGGRSPQGACALPRPGASPYEPSRGRGPGSAQFAGGYPGHCVLPGSSVSKSMKATQTSHRRMSAERAQFVRSRPRRCGGDITPHNIGVGVRECMCSARPTQATTYFDKVRRFIARSNGVYRVGRLMSSTAVAKSAPAADVNRLLPNHSRRCRWVWYGSPGLRNPSGVGPSALVGFRDFASIGWRLWF